MKIIKIRTGGPLHGDKCRHCKRACLPGQHVLDAVMLDAPPNNQHFTVHVACMNRLVAAAPEDSDMASWEATREAILKTGDPYAVAAAR